MPEAEQQSEKLRYERIGEDRVRIISGSRETIARLSFTIPAEDTKQPESQEQSLREHASGM